MLRTTPSTWNEGMSEWELFSTGPSHIVKTEEIGHYYCYCFRTSLSPAGSQTLCGVPRLRPGRESPSHGEDVQLPNEPRSRAWEVLTEAPAEQEQVPRGTARDPLSPPARS